MRVLSKKEKIATLRDLAGIYANYVHINDHLKQFPKTTVDTCPHTDCRRAVKILELTK